jgi:hypothetical protein
LQLPEPGDEQRGRDPEEEVQRGAEARVVEGEGCQSFNLQFSSWSSLIRNRKLKL